VSFSINKEIHDYPRRYFRVRLFGSSRLFCFSGDPFSHLPLNVDKLLSSSFRSQTGAFGAMIRDQVTSSTGLSPLKKDTIRHIRQFSRPQFKHSPLFSSLKRRIKEPHENQRKDKCFPHDLIC
jgi:hypothetical protein